MKGPVGLVGRYVWRLPAQILRVVDGDTVIVHVGIMPGKELYGEHVRVEGINAPERSAKGGAAATEFARQLLPIGSEVTLISSEIDKYGRLLAKIELKDGRDFSQTMIEAGHAVYYDP